MPSTVTYKTPAAVGLITGSGLFVSTDLDENARDVGSTIRPLFILVDNSGNTGAACWLKLYSAAAASVTVGTTVPWAIFKVPAGTILPIAIPTGLPQQANISAAIVTAAGTGGTTGPSTAVPARIHFAT